MKQLLLHAKTRLRLEHLLNQPPHAVLLTGKAGSGKTTAAQAFAAQLLGVGIDKLLTHPYVSVIDPEEGVITIDAIRALQQFLKLKVPHSDASRIQRVVLIARAERMRTEAQNALLKTLEEPPAGTVIIMTADRPALLLPTITSRVQLVSVLPVSEAQAREYFSASSGAEFARAYALSGGHAELLQALLENQSHPLLQDVELAKELLTLSPSDRLTRVDELAKDKQAVQQLLDALLRVTHAGLQAAATKQTSTAVNAWNKRQKAVLEATDYFQKNANTKLVLDNLFLHI